MIKGEIEFLLPGGEQLVTYLGSYLYPNIAPRPFRVFHDLIDLGTFGT